MTRFILIILFIFYINVFSHNTKCEVTGRILDNNNTIYSVSIVNFMNHEVVQVTESDKCGYFYINCIFADSIYMAVATSTKNSKYKLMSHVSKHYFAVNKITTSAFSISLAQFIERKDNKYVSIINAISMGYNMATRKGNTSDILLNPPNGNETIVLQRFHSLANLLVSRDEFVVNELLYLTEACNTIEAIANIIKYPILNKDEIFRLSMLFPKFQPYMTISPSSWTIPIKFTNTGSDIFLYDGPAAFSIDEEGKLWVTNNYQSNLEKSCIFGNINVTCAANYSFALI